MAEKNKYYETRFTFLESRKILWPIIARYLQKFVWNEKKILDIWCGYGDFINNIKWKEKKATDLNVGVKEYLNKEIDFEAKNIIKDNFSNSRKNCFDVVFMSNFLEHFDDNELSIILDKVREVLKKNGTLLLIQPNYYYMYREYFDDYTHKKVFTHHSLKDFIESQGFICNHLEKKFLPGSFKKNFLPIWLSKLLLTIYFKLPFRIWWQMFLVCTKKDD